MRRAARKNGAFWIRHHTWMHFWAQGHPPWINRRRPWLLLGRMVRRAIRDGVPPDEITDERFGWPQRHFTR